MRYHFEQLMDGALSSIRVAGRPIGLTEVEFSTTATITLDELTDRNLDMGGYFKAVPRMVSVELERQINTVLMGMHVAAPEFEDVVVCVRMPMQCSFVRADPPQNDRPIEPGEVRPRPGVGWHFYMVVALAIMPAPPPEFRGQTYNRLPFWSRDFPEIEGELVDLLLSEDGRRQLERTMASCFAVGACPEAAQGARLAV